MSLSSRWSLFSRGGGDKNQDHVESGDNTNGVEEEFSVKKEEEEVVVKEEETVVEVMNSLFAHVRWLRWAEANLATQERDRQASACFQQAA